MSYLHPRPVVVLGEALCDLLPDGPGISLSETAAFHPRPGGAPANLAVQLARLGIKSALLTAVGDDPLSARILQSLRDEGVETESIIVRQKGQLGLTFIAVDADGERAFYPWREGAADQTLQTSEIDEALILGAACLCRGTVSLRHEPVRAATWHAVKIARQASVPVVLDVNLRHRMWTEPSEMLALAHESVALADVVKATREEAAALFPSASTDHELLDALLDAGPQLAFLSLGAEGAWAATSSARSQVSAKSVAVVDATGAGDAFLGATVASLIANAASQDQALSLAACSDWRASDLELLLHFACAAGAAACRSMGATESMLRAASCTLPSLQSSHQET